MADNKLYMIERNDSIDYDEYDACVVVAESSEQALQIAKETYGTGRWDGWRNWDVTVEEVDLITTRIILGSFNAG